MSIRSSAPILALTLLAAFCAASASAQDSTQSTAPKAAASDADIDAMVRARDAQAGSPSAQPATQASAPAPAAQASTPPSPPSTPAPSAQSASAPSAQPAPAAADVDDAQAGRPTPLAPPNNTDRERAVTCSASATRLLDALQKADYTAATHDFDSHMREALPPDKFKQMWESLPAQFGALQARGQSHAGMDDQGYIAIAIPLIFDKANLYAQITCGEDNHIAGFYVKPLPVPASGANQ